MSRPKPTVLLESVDEDTGRCEQILEGEKLFVVVYKNKPFNLKSFNKMFDYPGPKYKKVSFTNPAHAYNLAEKLNTMYDVEDFDVLVIE